MYHKDGLIKKFPLQKKTILIGRNARNDIVLDDTGVSKRHCKVEVCDGYITVTDMNSLNGTFVHNSPVREAAVTLNQSFTVGVTCFFYKLGDINEFKINSELSTIISSMAKAKRKIDDLDRETEEYETKYNRLLQIIIEKAMTCDKLNEFIEPARKALSSIIRKGSLFFIRHNEWHMLLDHNKLAGLPGLEKHLHNRDEKEGALLLNEKNYYYRTFASGAGDSGSHLIFFYSKEFPAQPGSLERFLKKLSEIFELNLSIGPDVPLETEPEPLLFQGKGVTIAGVGETMKKVVELARKIAGKATFILIMGESGTGKELVAKMIHQLSHRDRYIAFNCAAIPVNLLESELFGYEKGAFTDAGKLKKGRIEEASGGTLVLDEIGDMPLETQAKLLRVIQEKSVVRLGGSQEIGVDLRIISMTNQDLYRLVEEKKFREDLFYRFRVHELRIPSLRERREDIPGLVRHFAKIYSEKNGVLPCGFSETFSEYFLEYDWPGNIRELENEMSRILEIIEDNELISDHHILPAITAACEKKRAAAKGQALSPLKEEVRDVEREKIISLLEQNKGNKTKTAKLVGMSYRGFLKKLKRLRID